MNIAAPVSSGNNSNPSGTSESDNPTINDSGSSTEGKKDSVSYDSYQKLLGEKKKASERLAALEADQKRREEADLVAKEDYKKLLEARDKELSEVKSILTKKEELQTSALKTRAILDGVNGTVDREYYDLLPVSEVVIDPETGLPDAASVRNAVKIVETKFAKIINPKAAKLPHSDAASGSSQNFESEIRAAKSQKDYDAVMKKYGKT